MLLRVYRGRSVPGLTGGARPSGRTRVAVVLLAVSGAWNGGNVGSVTSQIAADFDVSLAAVGLLAGTFFFGSTAIGLIVAAPVSERLGVRPSLHLTCWLTLSGNLIFAVSPLFAGLALGRVLGGLGFALTNAVGVVWARSAGGVGLLGLFGASIQVGVGGALLTGSVLSDLGADWRIGFAISAALALAALVAIPADAHGPAHARQRSGGFLVAAVSHVRVYRLALLFVAMFGVPLILSAWMIQYLGDEGGVSTTVAGSAAFLLFFLSAAFRVAGARLQQRGLPHVAMAGALGLAAVGMVALTLDASAAVAFGAAIILAAGFGIPYAAGLSEAQDLFPEEPFEPVALMILVALLLPVAAIPVVGRALDDGNGAVAFGILSAFVCVAAIANVRRTGIPLTAPDP
jgi:MFS family permease